MAIDDTITAMAIDGPIMAMAIDGTIMATAIGPTVTMVIVAGGISRNAHRCGEATAKDRYFESFA